MTTILTRSTDTLPAGLKPMGWLGQVAIAIAHSGAPRKQWQGRAEQLAAIGLELLGADRVYALAEEARQLNLATVNPRDVRQPIPTEALGHG